MPKVTPEWVASYRVTHSKHPETLVSLTKPPRRPEQVKALAVQEAARRWAVPWGSVYEECSIELVAESWHCVCDTCGQDFFSRRQTADCERCEDKRRLAALTRRPLRDDRRLRAEK